MADLPSTPDEHLTLDLISRIKGGQSDAWGELYDLYHDELLFAVRQKLGSRLRSVLQSEDVLQSVALEAFRDIDMFEDRGPGSLRAFLHRLVLNKIRDRAEYFDAKKRSGSVPLTPSIMETNPLPAADLAYRNGSAFEKLESCLARLPDDMREIIILRRIEGHSSKEIAERIGKTDASVRKTYSRALARLSLLMDDGGVAE